jgi:C4-type Zn-finger protein
MDSNNIIDNENIICPICGEVMKAFPYAYDNNQYGKKYYKCDVCGHKEVKII